MKAIRIRFAANTELEVIKVILLGAQLRQGIVEASFLVVTSLATKMILGTAYISRKIERISRNKSTLKSTGPSPVTMEETVGSVAYMAGSLVLKQGHADDGFNRYPCTAVCQRIVPFYE